MTVASGSFWLHFLRPISPNCQWYAHFVIIARSTETEAHLTPTYLIRADGNYIAAWPLWAIRKVERTDGDYLGLRDYTLLRFLFPEYSFPIRVFDHSKVLTFQTLYKAALDRAAWRRGVGTILFCIERPVRDRENSRATALEPIGCPRLAPTMAHDDGSHVGPDLRRGGPGAADAGLVR